MEILVGPIASGKSTYARQRADAGALVVCDDEIVNLVHGGNYLLYDKALKPLYAAVEYAIVTAAATARRNIVIDTGGRTRDKRTRFAALGRSLGYEVKAVLFPWHDPEEHARRRFNSDPRGMTFDQWRRVAVEHERQFQPVTPIEGLT